MRLYACVYERTTKAHRRKDATSLCRAGVPRRKICLNFPYSVPFRNSYFHARTKRVRAAPSPNYSAVDCPIHALAAKVSEVSAPSCTFSARPKDARPVPGACPSRASPPRRAQALASSPPLGFLFFLRCLYTDDQERDGSRGCARSLWRGRANAAKVARSGLDVVVVPLWLHHRGRGSESGALRANQVGTTARTLPVSVFVSPRGTLVRRRPVRKVALVTSYPRLHGDCVSGGNRW